MLSRVYINRGFVERLAQKLSERQGVLHEVREAAGGFQAGTELDFTEPKTAFLKTGFTNDKDPEPSPELTYAAKISAQAIFVQKLLHTGLTAAEVLYFSEVFDMAPEEACHFLQTDAHVLPVYPETTIALIVPYSDLNADKDYQFVEIGETLISPGFLIDVEKSVTKQVYRVCMSWKDVCLFGLFKYVDMETWVGRGYGFPIIIGQETSI